MPNSTDRLVKQLKENLDFIGSVSAERNISNVLDETFQIITILTALGVDVSAVVN